MVYDFIGRLNYGFSKIDCNIIRFLIITLCWFYKINYFLTIVKFPFCTAIGMLLSSAYSFITINGLFYKYYKISNDGFIEKKLSQGTNT